jgi:hypothetical protein
MVDGVVAVLLVLTIGYCMLLNRRLKLLKADEQSLRATISELVTATEIAERAIGGLKLTVHECDMGLGERLRKAERASIEMDRAIVAGKDLLGRLSQIVSAGRHSNEPVATPDEARREGTTGNAKSVIKTGTAHGANDDATTSARASSTTNTKASAKNGAKAVAAAAEAFAERLRTKVHGLAA